MTYDVAERLYWLCQRRVAIEDIRDALQAAEDEGARSAREEAERAREDLGATDCEGLRDAARRVRAERDRLRARVQQLEARQAYGCEAYAPRDVLRRGDG